MVIRPPWNLNSSSANTFPGFSFIESSFSWRFPLAFQCIYPLLALILLGGLPESPRVLYFWGRTGEADAVLHRLHDSINGENTAANEIVEYEKTQILNSIRMEREATKSGYSWRDLLWDKSPVHNSRRLFIVVVMQALQQLGKLFFKASSSLTNHQ